MKGLTGAIIRKSFDLNKQLALVDDMFRKSKADFQADYHRLDALRAESHIRCFAPEGLTYILHVNDGENSILNVKKTYRSIAHF